MSVAKLSEAQKLAELLRLYNQLGANSAVDAAHQLWLNSLGESVAIAHADDGDPTVFALKAPSGLKLCGFRWAAPSLLDRAPAARAEETSDFVWSASHQPVNWAAAKGVIVYCHGIIESARTSLLRCRATEAVLGPNDHLHTQPLTHLENELLILETKERQGFHVVFEKSWVDQFTRAGYVVYALDQEGHGYSQGWQGQRCHIERLRDLQEDLLTLLTRLLSTKEVPYETPLFVAGLSMGGLVATRALELGFERRTLSTPSNRIPGTPVISGLCLLCPAISGERLKKKFPNQFLQPISSVLSVLTPKARLVSLQDATPFPFLGNVIANDPLVYEGRLPIRISAECLSEMNLVMPNAHHLPPTLRVLLIQSKYDTMTDPEGSAKFIDIIQSSDKHVQWLDHSWHWLAREPGYGRTCEIMLSWFEKRF